MTMTIANQRLSDWNDILGYFWVTRKPS